MSVIARLAVFALVFTLAACDSGPSDAEVVHAAKDHLVKAISGQQTLSRFMLGDAAAKTQQAKMTAEIDSMEVIVGGKTKQPDGAYSVVVTLRDGKDSKTQTLRMLKGPEGWVVAD